MKSQLKHVLCSSNRKWTDGWMLYVACNEGKCSMLLIIHYPCRFGIHEYTSLLHDDDDDDDDDVKDF